MGETEQETLARCVAQADPDAFRRMVERHGDMVFAACHRILENGADAEDAAQEVFLHFVRHAPKLRAPVAGWLHRVATNVSIDLLRWRKARAAREVKASRERPPVKEPSWDDLKGDVDRAIGQLPDDLRAAIVLHYLEGRRQEEIAQELGLSATAISKRLRRGVEQLQKHLRKAGWTVSLAAIPTLLLTHGAESAPATLVAALGKLALSAASAQTVATTTSITAAGTSAGPRPARAA